VTDWPEPHEGVVGVDRSGDWLLSLDERAVAHRDAILGLAYHVWSATSVGSPAPVVERMDERLRNPVPGDFVWVIDGGLDSRKRDLDRRIKALGFLVVARREWWTTTAEWERMLADDERYADDERDTDMAWYVQYGPDPADVCRWTGCTVLVVPVDQRMFMD
jgi:hypothetical protein